MWRVSLHVIPTTPNETKAQESGGENNQGSRFRHPDEAGLVDHGKNVGGRIRILGREKLGCIGRAAVRRETFQRECVGHTTRCERAGSYAVVNPYNVAIKHGIARGIRRDLNAEVIVVGARRRGRVCRLRQCQSDGKRDRVNISAEVCHAIVVGRSAQVKNLAWRNPRKGTDWSKRVAAGTVEGEAVRG